MRYRFYREHKYVSYRLYQYERNCAQTDFTLDEEVLSLKLQLESIQDLMLGHAEHENNAIHALLRAKGSLLTEKIEHEHQTQAATFTRFFTWLQQILETENVSMRIQLGNEYYLTYRLFVAQNLQHFHEEETLIQSELQRFYNDDELRAVDSATYAVMSIDEMVGMLATLFPHLNREDRQFFLEEIKLAEPEKFKALLPEIRALLTPEEKVLFKTAQNTALS